MSPNTISHLAQDKVARITGGFYLGFLRDIPIRCHRSANCALVCGSALRSS